MGKETTQQECSGRVGPLVNIPGLLLELGHEPEPIFARNGFELSEFDDTENRISYIRGSQLLADCVAETGNETFGLHCPVMTGTPRRYY